MRIVLFALAAGCIYLALRPRELGEGDTLDLGGFMPDLSSIQPENIVGEIVGTVRGAVGAWRPPARFIDAIRQAEDANGIPRDILARLLFQECHWREDIISGRTRSAAGAIGIAQFMPDTAADEGVDPLDPYASIAAAGRYLAKLFRKFGRWAEALAAYNWGQGNVSRKGLVNAPAETRNYYSQILADVNAANGTGWA